MGGQLIFPGSAHRSSSVPAPQTPPTQLSSLIASDPSYTSNSTPGLTQDNTPATSRYIATPPDLQNALNFRASSRAPTFLLGARLLMNRFPRNPPVQTDRVELELLLTPQSGRDISLHIRSGKTCLERWWPQSLWHFRDHLHGEWRRRRGGEKASALLRTTEYLGETTTRRDGQDPVEFRSVALTAQKGRVYISQ
jgi:hypothetical protein